MAALSAWLYVTKKPLIRPTEHIGAILFRTLIYHCAILNRKLDECVATASYYLCARAL
jgi:hypothetical protein